MVQEVKGNPALKTPIKGMPWNFRLIASGDETVADAFERLYRGVDPVAKKGAYGDKPYVPQLGADEETTRHKFITHFGFDPFKVNEKTGKIAPFLDQKITDPVTGQLVEIGKLTIKEAEDRWRSLRRSKASSGFLRLGSRWVKDTPENRIEKRRGQMAVEGIELARYNKWIPIESAKDLKEHPLFQRKLSRYILQTRDAVPGVPLPVMRRWLHDAAKDEIVRKHWFGVGMKPRIAVLKKLRAKRPDGTSLPEKDVERLIGKYDQGLRDVMRKHSSKIPQMVDRALSRKGLVKTMVTISHPTFPDQAFTFEAGSNELQNLLNNHGWKEKKRVGQPLRQPEEADITLRKGVTVHPDLEEGKWRDIAKKVGIERKYIRDAVKWAHGEGIWGYAKKMEELYGRDAAIIRTMALYNSHVKAMKEHSDFEKLSPDEQKKMKNPFGGGYRPAHGLGKYGFANWHRAEGFEGKGSRANFVIHIKSTIEARKQKMRAEIKSGKLSDSQKAEYLRRIAGYDKAIELAGKAQDDLDGTPIGSKEKAPFHDPFHTPGKMRKRYRVQPLTRNAYGMLVRTDPNAFLYAAYYDLFGKDKEGDYVPSHKRFAGLTQEIPRHLAFNKPKVVTVVDKDGNQRKLLDTSIQEVVVDSWGQALSGGAGTAKDMLLARMRLQRAVEVARAKGGNVIDDVGAWVEQALFLPGRMLKAGEGAMEGLFGGFGKNVASVLATWRPGKGAKTWSELRLVRPMNEDEMRSYALELSKRGTIKGRRDLALGKFGAWKMNNLFIEARDRDQEIAKASEEHYKKNLDKGVIESIYKNLDDIVVGISSLPGMLLDPKTPSKQMLTGRTMGDRYLNALSKANDLGFQMGSGTQDFLFQLLTKPQETIRAAPIDSLLTILPTLTNIKKTGKWAGKKVSPEVMNKLNKLRLWAKSIETNLSNKSFAPIGKIITRTYNASEAKIISAAKKWDAVKEMVKQGKSNLAQYVVSSMSLRNLNSRALTRRIHEGIMGGGDLRAISDELRQVFKKGGDDPALLKSYLDAFKDSVSNSLIDAAGLRKLIDEGDALVKQLENLEKGEFVNKGISTKNAWYKSAEKRKQRINAVIESLKGDATKLAEILTDPRKIDIEGAKAQKIRELLAPREKYTLAGDVRGRHGTPYVHSDWSARSTVIKALLDPTTGAKKERFVYADPKKTIAELERLKKGIVEGKIPVDATEWLFGQKYDLDGGGLTGPELNSKLGADRKFHGIGKNNAQPLTNNALKIILEKLKFPDSRNKVVKTINEQIEHLKTFEVLSDEARSALGLKGRTKNKHGIIDEEFGPALSTSRMDGTGRKSNIPDEGVAGLGPNVYVPKGTSAKILEAKKSQGTVRVDAPDDLPPNITKRGMKLLISEINSKAKDKGMPLLKDPSGKGFMNTKSADLRKIISEYYDKNGALPTGSEKLVRELFGVDADQLVNFKIEQAKLGTEGLIKKFDDAVAKHGPEEAFNVLFGNKPGSPINIGAIENIPGLADIIASLEPGAASQVIQSIRLRMLRDVVGPKKAVAGFANRLAAKLDEAATKKEGAAVKEWWKKQGGSSDNLTPQKIASGEVSFIDDVVNGTREADIPAVLEMSPDAIIRAMDESKDALWKKAEARGVSKLDFERAYSNAQMRLRKFEVVDKDARVKFGLTLGDAPVYVPQQVNAALAIQRLSSAQIGGVFSWIKRNLTSRNATTFVNNYMSSAVLQFGRLGKVVNPFKYHKILRLRKEMQSLNYRRLKPDDPKRVKIKQEFEAEMGKLGIDPVMVENIVGVGKFLDSGMFEIEAGGKVTGFHKLNPLKKLEEAYQFTDQGFKFDEAIRGYKQIKGAYDDIAEGKRIKIEVAPGEFLEVIKRKNGADIVGPTGKIKGTLTKVELEQQFGRASSVQADRLFVNYSDLPKLLAHMRSNMGLQALGAVAPMLTWAYKALWVPGKKGPASEFFNPTPFISTSDAKVGARLLKAKSKAQMRMFAATQLGRDRLLAMDPDDLSAILDYLPGEMKTRLIADLSQQGFLRTKDLSWMNPFGPNLTLLKVMRAGQWHLFEKDELYGDENSKLKSLWLSQSGKNKREKLMHNLLNKEGEKNGYSKDGKLTKKGKELVKLRSYITSRARRSPNEVGYDLAKLTLLTGPGLRDFVNTALRMADSSSSPAKQVSRMSNNLMTVLLGGTVARAVDVAVGITDKNNVFSSRSRTPITSEGESALRFAIRRLTGIGYDIQEVAQNKARYLGKVKTNFNVAFLGDPKVEGSLKFDHDRLEEIKKKKGLTKDQTKDLRRLKAKMGRLQKIIHSEMQLLDYNLTTALRLRAAAVDKKYRRRRGKKGIRFERRSLVRDGDRWKFVVEKDGPTVEKYYRELYKMEPQYKKGSYRLKSKRIKTYKEVRSD
jgi:hypothetical protein